MPEPARLRVIVVEDEDLFRDLLTTSLEAEPDLDVVGSFGDSSAALALVPPLKPDVVLLDIELGHPPDGIHLGLELRRQLPELGIVVLSHHADARFLTPLPRGGLGGWSYLLKSSVREHTVLARAIRGAAAGEVVLDPELVRRREARPGTPLARLAPRQREILGLVAQGWTNAAIAEKLSIAEKSVENALTITYEHLGLDRRQSARHVRVEAVLAYLHDGEPIEPAATASEATSGATSGPRSGTPDAPALHPAPTRPHPDQLSVLLVDDQQAFLDAASVVLGADPRLRIVGTASSGPEALRVVTQQAPGMLLLDVQMPGMNGFEAARAIRALLPEVHIVFVSSEDEPAYASVARRLGDGFIAKSRLSAQAVLDLVVAASPR